MGIAGFLDRLNRSTRLTERKVASPTSMVVIHALSHSQTYKNAVGSPIHVLLLNCLLGGITALSLNYTVCGVDRLSERKASFLGKSHHITAATKVASPKQPSGAVVNATPRVRFAPGPAPPSFSDGRPFFLGDKALNNDFTAVSRLTRAGDWNVGPWY